MNQMSSITVRPKTQTNNLISLKQSTNNKLKWCEKSFDRDGVKQPIDEK